MTLKRNPNKPNDLGNETPTNRMTLKRTPLKVRLHLRRPPPRTQHPGLARKTQNLQNLHGLSPQDSHDGVGDVGWDDVHRVNVELMQEFDVLGWAVRIPQRVVEGVFAHRLLQVFCQLLDRQGLVGSGWAAVDGDAFWPAKWSTVSVTILVPFKNNNINRIYILLSKRLVYEKMSIDLPSCRIA